MAVVAAIVLVIGLQRRIDDAPAPTHDDWTGERLGDVAAPPPQAPRKRTVAEAVAARHVDTDPFPVMSARERANASDAVRGGVAEPVEGENPGLGPVATAAINGRARATPPGPAVNGAGPAQVGSQASADGARPLPVVAAGASAAVQPPVVGRPRHAAAADPGAVSVAVADSAAAPAPRPITTAGGAAPGKAPNVVNGQAPHHRPADEADGPTSRPDPLVGAVTSDHVGPGADPRSAAPQPHPGPVADARSAGPQPPQADPVPDPRSAVAQPQADPVTDPRSAAVSPARPDASPVPCGTDPNGRSVGRARPVARRRRRSPPGAAGPCRPQRARPRPAHPRGPLSPPVRTIPRTGRAPSRPNPHRRRRTTCPVPGAPSTSRMAPQAKPTRRPRPSPGRTTPRRAPRLTSAGRTTSRSRPSSPGQIGRPPPGPPLRRACPPITGWMSAPGSPRPGRARGPVAAWTRPSPRLARACLSIIGRSSGGASPRRRPGRATASPPRSRRCSRPGPRPRRRMPTDVATPGIGSSPCSSTIPCAQWAPRWTSRTARNASTASPPPCTTSAVDSAMCWGDSHVPACAPTSSPASPDFPTPRSPNSCAAGSADNALRSAALRTAHSARP